MTGDRDDRPSAASAAEGTPRVRRLDLAPAASPQETPPPGTTAPVRRLFDTTEAPPEKAEQARPRLVFGGSVQRTFAITEEDLRALDPSLAEGELLHGALVVAWSFSAADPASRFAVYGSDLQERYGRILEEALKLSREAKLRGAKARLRSLLGAVDAIDFSAVLSTQGSGLWQWITSKLSKAPEPARPDFGKTVRIVRKQQRALKARIADLQRLRERIVTLEERQKELLHDVYVHLLAGRGVLPHLTDDRRQNLQGRLLSLEMTAATAATERHGEMLRNVVDELIRVIRDTILTWVPVWLSMLNDTVVLIDNDRFTEDAEAYRRLLEARAKILSLKGKV